jgi:hypothetical protein
VCEAELGLVALFTNLENHFGAFPFAFVLNEIYLLSNLRSEKSDMAVLSGHSGYIGHSGHGCLETGIPALYVCCVNQQCFGICRGKPLYAGEKR